MSRAPHSGFEETSFLTGINACFIETLYADYLQSPDRVDISWQTYFASLGETDLQILQESLSARHPVWEKKSESVDPAASHSSSSAAALSASPQRAWSEASALQQMQDALRVHKLIRAYRVRGHLKAQIDPLGLTHHENYQELQPAYYGFTEQDLQKSFYCHGFLNRSWATLAEILQGLQTFYCGAIGVEYLHIQSPEEKAWIEEKIEGFTGTMDVDDKKQALESLTRAATFERFLQVKFPGAKRFGLEGGEGMIPALETLLSVSGQEGVREVIIGMAHRGRLNVLTTLLNKPARALFSKFQPRENDEEHVQGSGDVKYHLGSSADRDFGGTILHLSLASNPSHLEAVDPVVVGKVRAKQARRGDQERSEVMGLLIHGDAALAGQGLVGETLDLSDLRGYKTGGTIHFVINNQIGFTTSPIHSRSSAYCTDIAKKIQAPIFHVNGENPEALLYVSMMAAQYRKKFKRDVFIDMVCYRRHGHNEMDEPSFTQPQMYAAIRTRAPLHQLYGQRLAQEGVVDAAEPARLIAKNEDHWQEEFAQAQEYKPDKADWLEGAWQGLQGAYNPWENVVTGVDKNILLEIGKALSHAPTGLHLHPRLDRLFQAKQEMFSTYQNIDWATAEALAFGSLLCDRYAIRLSGQDSGRGTFSQRHAVLIDQNSGAPYIPLNNIRVNQAEIEIVDSPLSEAAVLGFEHGYTLADPNTLVLWEAQFGDFANGAQVMIDQFIAAGEAKWLRLSGLVMLLPHGYEGQGPEHSSARLERYLQLCAEDNIQVANCTTPANYFHLLRRQMISSTRKPLIIMTPKSLLRHKLAVSTLDDLASQTSFKPVYEDTDQSRDPRQVKRVVLCSGKIYYDLLEKRSDAKIQDTVLLRVEQFHPFPEESLKRVLGQYLQAEIIWCQEEPANMGAWSFVDRRLEQVLRAIGSMYQRPLYSGRPASASTATGSHDRHVKEQNRLIAQTLGLKL